MVCGNPFKVLVIIIGNITYKVTTVIQNIITSYQYLGYECELILFLSIFHFHLSKSASLPVAFAHLKSSGFSNVLETIT